MSEMSQRETDLVLNPNEYAYVLDKTKGLISCVVGSYKMSLSTSDELVRFNEDAKRFEKCDFRDAITTFTSAPENWYVQLKNPAVDQKHPTTGTSNQLPELSIGMKINIPGPTSFALYPGQMARVIKGHRLNKNQYLLVKVYDPEALKESDMIDFFYHTEEVDVINDDKVTSTQEVSVGPGVGEIFLIKGTETQFFIPPTGVEVIPTKNYDKGGYDYVRDAITLERLEYCVLMNEKGEKKYIHGPAVVFPEPDEKVVLNKDKGSMKFRAIELSDISGIYVKVICDYKEGDREYKAGEELFITGKEKRIYYPRAEHSIISYDGNIVHHAVAIPEGEGRYVMDRMTGKIRMEKGPSMFLPDPRKEVIVNRRLTRKQCELWYPGNTEVLEHNCPSLTLSKVEDNISYNTRAYDSAISTIDYSKSYVPTSLSSTSNSYTGPITTALNYDDSEANVDFDIRRQNKYTKLRSITIDNKYDGVVSVDIWTGYAVNVVSKDGKRKVVVGPQTYLMEYDESLEVLELSTGKPKTTDKLFKTVYLGVENNKISDIINVETKDFVTVQVKVSYCVDFIDQDSKGTKYKDKWFSVENYVKYLCDRERSLIKREAKKYTVEEFYENASDIVRTVALDIYTGESEATAPLAGRPGRFFKENGMLVHDIEVLSVRIDDNDVSYMIDNHQKRVIEDSLELAANRKKLESAQELADLEKKEKEIETEKDKKIEELENELKLLRLKNEAEINKNAREEKERQKEAEEKLQEIEDRIHQAILARRKADTDQEIAKQKMELELKTGYEKNNADNVIAILKAVSPQLAAAMEERSNAELMASLVESMSPYAMAEGRPVEEYVNKLLRGTSMEEVIAKITKNQKTSLNN